MADGGEPGDAAAQPEEDWGGFDPFQDRPSNACRPAMQTVQPQTAVRKPWQIWIRATMLLATACRTAAMRRTRQATPRSPNPAQPRRNRGVAGENGLRGRSLLMMSFRDLPKRLRLIAPAHLRLAARNV